MLPDFKLETVGARSCSLAHDAKLLAQTTNNSKASKDLGQQDSGQNDHSLAGTPALWNSLRSKTCMSELQYGASSKGALLKNARKSFNQQICTEPGESPDMIIGGILLHDRLLEHLGCFSAEER